MHRNGTFSLLSGLAFACGAHGEAIDAHWTLAVDDSIGYETVMSLAQASPDSIADEYANGTVHPIIEFRCVKGGDGSISFRIDWRRFISSFNTEVGFRVDEGGATWLRLGVDESNRITLSKSPADATALIGKLAGAKVLDVEVAPYSEASVFVSFDVSTLDPALDALRKACDRA